MLLGGQKNHLQLVDSYNNSWHILQDCSYVELNWSKTRESEMHLSSPYSTEQHEAHQQNNEVTQHDFHSMGTNTVTVFPVFSSLQHSISEFSDQQQFNCRVV